MLKKKKKRELSEDKPEFVKVTMVCLHIHTID